MPTTYPKSDPPENLVELVRLAQQRDEEATRILLERCRQPLLAVIRKILTPRSLLRRLFDSEDFLMEAFQKILNCHFKENVLASPGRLWAYLKTLTINDVRDARRRYLVSQRRSMRRVVRLEGLHLEEELTSREFSPEHWLIFKELAIHLVWEFIHEFPYLLQGSLTVMLHGGTAVETARVLKVDLAEIIKLKDWLEKRVAELKDEG